MRECSNRERVLVIVAREVTNATPAVVGAMTMNAITVVTASARAELLYVPMPINGVDVEATVDTGTSHLFVSEQMAEKIQLRTSPSEDRVKRVNTAEQRIMGIAYDIPMELERWPG